MNGKIVHSKRVQGLWCSQPGRRIDQAIIGDGVIAVVCPVLVTVVVMPPFRGQVGESGTHHGVIENAAAGTDVAVGVFVGVGVGTAAGFVKVAAHVEQYPVLAQGNVNRAASKMRTRAIRAFLLFL